MSASLEYFVTTLRDQLGDVYDLTRDEQVGRWINRGRARLGLLQSMQATLSWTNGDASVALPADCVRVDRIVPESPSCLPPHLLRTSSIAFLTPASVTAGSAVLYYGAEYADVDGATDSTMPSLADEAAISFVLARFFQRLASNRSLYQRYVTVTGQSGIEVQDLVDLSVQHDGEFAELRAELLNAGGPTTFFAD